MGRCIVCQTESDRISQRLGLCRSCILADTSAARRQAAEVHARSRQRFGLPAHPPRSEGGLSCRKCINACKIGAGQLGYCGVRSNHQGHISGGTAEAAAVQWYYDALPTNCVADWVCPASGQAGYPDFTDTKGPEHGYYNLAVFYQACSFDCLFCQNWHFKEHSITGPRHSASELTDAVNPQTRCICYFGGDPSCQVDHALAASNRARERGKGHAILRICWETNGSMSRPSLEKMAEISLASGGCIKFDLKAWDEPLHRALCGVSNRMTLENFEYLGRWIDRRPDPPFLVASTLMVPGYIDAQQVGRIAEFIARIDPNIPYALLAFHPSFEMTDLPTTPRDQATESLSAAEAAGLKRVRVGNVHLLK